MKKSLKLYDIISGYDNVNDVTKSVELTRKARKDLYSYDKALLEATDLRYDYDEFQNIPDGRFVITHRNIDFDCLFKKDNNSDNLYVVFSGARPVGQKGPLFKRWSYYKFMDGSMLNIDDPMYKIYRELHCGWYYGNADEAYCDYIVEIVNKFAEQINAKNIIFFSSSGGGMPLYIVPAGYQAVSQWQ